MANRSNESGIARFVVAMAAGRDNVGMGVSDG